MLVEPLELQCAVPSFSRHNILIVDDDESISEPLKMRLESQGFGAHVAPSGEAALDYARRHRPDCITLDLGLPDVDGFELCQQLVDDSDTCEIPVIVVSGMERPDIIRRSRAAGCHFYVRKPYDPNALLTLIRRAIDESRGDEQGD